MFRSFLSSLVQANGKYDISFACVIIPLFARSDCKINDISADFITAMKCREMQGKRVNTIDNEIFENLP